MYIYVFYFIYFNYILPHKSFLKQELLKEAVLQYWWSCSTYSSPPTCSGGKSSLESSVSL